MTGWHGRLLDIDLTTGLMRPETIAPELLQNYLGGRGLGVRLMREHYQLDPFSPEIPLIFAVGPLCGTPAPTAARMGVVSRSPLSKTIHDSSSGGKFPWRLKAAGFDALRIVGQSAEPVVLKVTPQGGELLAAKNLWGKTVGETVKGLDRYGSVAAIGPAGENRVLFANIMMGEGNSVGRGGLGAVMGAKRLKAICVAGNLETEVLDQERFDIARKDVIRLFNASPVIYGDLG
ncbi:MAG: aldehyde:ferredoxin oxidoreductase, partial [Desulfuromonadaceae bacterium]|nr:aldehyde:ferredoxin oxidoreductase [Desulfuromonadaceae bacterium]